MDDKLDCALDLMRRLKPNEIESNLAGLIDLVPDLVEQLLSAVDQPLKVAHDTVSRRDYLLCDYNRDGDSYRSPWSNQYEPKIDDGAVPSPDLRKTEIAANEIFDIYRDLYFEGGVSSVYCWDLDDGFAACILIKKVQDQSKKGQPMKGAWDSIHVIEVADSKTKAHNKLTSTVMLNIETETATTGRVSLAGSLTRQSENDFSVNDITPHTSNIGRMVEEMENKLRTTLEQIYFGKTKDIVNELRSIMSTAILNQRKDLQKQIGTSIGNK